MLWGVQALGWLGLAGGGLSLVPITAVRWGFKGITRCVPVLGSRRGLYLAEPVCVGEGKKRGWLKQSPCCSSPGKLIFVQLGMPNDRCFPCLLLENSQE